MSLRLLRLLPSLLLASVGLLSTISGAQAEVSQVMVAVEGMTCPFCSFGVAKRLKKVTGVEDIHVDTDLGLATVTAAAGESIDLPQVPEAVKSAGFTPGVVRIIAIGTLQMEEGQIYLRLRNQEQILRLSDSSSIASERLLSLMQENADVEVTGTWNAAGTDKLSELKLEAVKIL